MTGFSELPIPGHFSPDSLSSSWPVPYEQRAAEARQWASLHGIPPAHTDEMRICLLLVDCQNTFCLPDHELFVAGRSGDGAVRDNVRLARFIYRNLVNITFIHATLDSHRPMQIFHAAFWVNADGEHPPPLTTITLSDVENGTWTVNPMIAKNRESVDHEWVSNYAHHYVKQLKESGKYDLTVWPYHAMLGSVGHALVSAIEEAVFFHGMARGTQGEYEVKGRAQFTEHYSALSPEVLGDQRGEPVAEKNVGFIETILDYDVVIMAGQAKSHCLAWTVDDLLSEIELRDKLLSGKVYLLEDCTSPVVVPDVADYTEAADAAFRRFAEAGMHVVSAETPLSEWPGKITAG